MNYIKSNFQADAKLEIDKVRLNVANLEMMANYYKLLLKMEIIEQTQEMISLGTGNKVLLELYKSGQETRKDKTTGLYHVAYLINKIEDFAAILKYLVAMQIPLGAADHGYSYALYTEDPEGNGIEIYHDLEREHWTIEADGEIIGKTDPLPGDKLMAMDTPEYLMLPLATKVGHVHLKTHSLIDDRDFYVNILGFDQKTILGDTAAFLATGSYHHHIALNVWEGKNLPNRSEDDLGINTIYFKLEDSEELKKLRDNLIKHEIKFSENKGILKLVDPNNINLLYSF